MSSVAAHQLNGQLGMASLQSIDYSGKKLPLKEYTTHRNLAEYVSLVSRLLAESFGGL